MLTSSMYKHALLFFFVFVLFYLFLPHQSSSPARATGPPALNPPPSYSVPFKAHFRRDFTLMVYLVDITPIPPLILGFHLPKTPSLGDYVQCYLSLLCFSCICAIIRFPYMHPSCYSFDFLHHWSISFPYFIYLPFYSRFHLSTS